MTLSKDELCNISGGGYGWLAIVGAALTFVIGFVDGVLRPMRCN